MVRTWRSPCRGPGSIPGQELKTEKENRNGVSRQLVTQADEEDRN